jgi:hypothetical protein
VAEGLVDGKRITVGLRSNVSLLSEIAVYTYAEEIKLAAIFKAIATKENENQTAISHKEDSAVLVAYFREILADFDEDRVYPSDIKKIINWYNILQPKGIVSLENLAKESEEATETAEVEDLEKNK